MSMTREEMIDALTGSMFDSMECDADYRWAICREGFKGFNNFTDEELKTEYLDYISDDYEETEE